MTEVLLGPAGGDHIAIRVLRRKYPQANDYWDGNWLDAEVEVEVKPWHARYIANLRTDEFAGFRQELEGMYAMARRDAKFSPMEPWLELGLHLDSLGHIDMTGNIGPEGFGKVFGQARLVFEIQKFMDQTFLPPIIEQLRATEVEFHIVGRPDA
jgi:hypothetical protein